MASQGTLTWAGDTAPASRELLSATAQEFGLTARFCTLREVPDTARGGGCEVIGLEVGSDPGRALGLVTELRGRLPRTTILLATRDGSVGFIRAALEAGANDVLSLPLQPADLHKALIRAMQTGPRTPTAPESLGQVITVCGARGGLGATTVAVNLAVRLATLTGADTALVDLDLQRGDVAAFLNLTPINSLANLAAAPGEVDEIFLAGALTRHPSGVFVLPAPPQLEDADGIGHDDVKVALDLLRAQFRFTVIDTARTITGATLAAFETSQRLLLLTDLSVPGVRAARRIVELLGRLEVPMEQVELLVTEAVAGPVGLPEAVRAIGKQPLLVLPRDDATAAEAMNQGAPLNGKQTRLSLALTALATKVAGIAADKPKSGQLFRRLLARSSGRVPA